MTIKTSGELSFQNDIVAEFGGTTPHQMSEYYKGGANVPTGATDPNTIPSSGTIRFSDFYGSSSYVGNVNKDQTYTFDGQYYWWRTYVLTNSIYGNDANAADFTTFRNAWSFTGTTESNAIPSSYTSKYIAQSWYASAYRAFFSSNYAGLKYINGFVLIVPTGTTWLRADLWGGGGGAGAGWYSSSNGGAGQYAQVSLLVGRDIEVGDRLLIFAGNGGSSGYNWQGGSGGSASFIARINGLSYDTADLFPGPNVADYFTLNTIYSRWVAVRKLLYSTGDFLACAGGGGGGGYTNTSAAVGGAGGAAGQEGSAGGSGLSTSGSAATASAHAPLRYTPSYNWTQASNTHQGFTVDIAGINDTYDNPDQYPITGTNAIEMMMYPPPCGNSYMGQNPNDANAIWGFYYCGASQGGAGLYTGCGSPIRLYSSAAAPGAGGGYGSVFGYTGYLSNGTWRNPGTTSGLLTSIGSDICYGGLGNQYNGLQYSQRKLGTPGGFGRVAFRCYS